MFDAELFGMTAKEYFATAQAFMAPMLGFMFLYLLSLPLRKLPYLDIAEYQPPSWVLPLFAVGSLGIVAFCVTVAILLSVTGSSSFREEFVRSFQVIRYIPSITGRVREARISLAEYDRESNFRIFINGYRVIGSSSNCVMEYQCRRKGDKVAERGFAELAGLSLSDATIYDIYRINSLPHSEDFAGLLVEGSNYIEIDSENTGVGACALKVLIGISTDDEPQSEFTITISSDVGVTPALRAPLQRDEVFYSGGEPTGQEGGVAPIDPVYGTYRANGSYRVCQRIRIPFELAKGQLSGIAANWNSWAKSRRRDIVCAIRNNTRDGCRP